MSHALGKLCDVRYLFLPGLEPTFLNPSKTFLGADIGALHLLHILYIYLHK